MVPDASRLIRRILELTGVEPARLSLAVAFSGGVDSTVLLHLAARIDIGRLRALHVDHGMHPGSADWAEHCRAVCRSLDVPCEVLRVQVRDEGRGPEAAAREARYEAFARALEPAEVLATAHHRDDQLETFLLQALRGAGPPGLAGMPASAPFAAGRLVRPLLECDRRELETFARGLGVDWLEDPANRDPGLDRSFLRRRVLPPLRERWPDAAAGVARSARLSGEAAELLDQLARLDLAGRAGSTHRLDVSGLQELDDARLRNLLRRWLRDTGLPPPPGRQLERIAGELVGARRDAEPRVAWSGGEVRAWRDALYAMHPLDDPPTARLVWEGASPLTLPAGLGSLELKSGAGRLDPAIRERAVTVGFRGGGERLRPVGRGVTRTVKGLLQEAGVVPWMRGRLPLLHIDGRLAAVADLWVDEAFAVAEGEGLGVRWHGRPALC